VASNVAGKMVCELTPINGHELTPINGRELTPINGRELTPINGRVKAIRHKEIGSEMVF
jgi:hypothetical protein